CARDAGGHVWHGFKTCCAPRCPSSSARPRSCSRWRAVCRVCCHEREETQMTTTAGTRSHSARGAGRAAAGGSRLRWMAAAVLITGALMDLIDVTIVNVALPTIRRNLGASATQLEWVVSGSLLAFAAILIIAGSLGDRFGRKRLFLAGVGVFGAASLGAGLSGSAAELIAARVVQGVGAAMMAPQVLATFRVIFSG